MSLPNTRPVAATFGPDMVDDSPVVDPTLETPASVWNLLRNAMAFVGQVCALSVTKFKAADATVLFTLGGAMTGTHLGAGDYQLATSGGWTVNVAKATIQSPDITVQHGTCEVQVVNATTVRVRTRNGAGALADFDFLLECH